MLNREERNGKIYAVLFNNGYMKAGRAYRNADGRIREHIKKAAIIGAEKVCDVVIDIPYALHKCERELLTACDARFAGVTTFGREWYCGVSQDHIAEMELIMRGIAAQSSGLAHTCITEAMATNPLRNLAAVAPPVVQQVDIAYIEALGIAKGMQAMITNDLISGAVFTTTEALRGLSYFTVTMSLYLYGMADDERGECMREIVEGLAHSDLHGLFGLLSKAELAARKAVGELLDEEAPASSSPN